MRTSFLFSVIALGGLSFASISSSALAAGGHDKTEPPISVESLSDVSSMVRLADGTFQVSCRDGRSEIRSEADILANRVCLGGGGGGSGNFVYGTSDSCSSDAIIGAVTASTNCSSFSSSQSAWSVRLNGTCQNTSDTNAQRACLYVQGNLPNTGVIYGTSDSCSADAAIGTVTSSTSCEQFPDSGSTWSISFNGSCRNISDTTPKRACFEIKGNQMGSGIIYGTSDSCSADAAIAAVDTWTDCNQFSTSGSAWSVKVNGQCRNISDTNPRNACFVIQGG